MNLFDPTRSPAQNYGRQRYYSVEQLEQLYPREQNENLLSYRTRLRNIQTENQNNGPPRPDLFSAEPQAQHEDNLHYGIRSRVTAPAAAAVGSANSFLNNVATQARGGLAQAADTWRNLGPNIANGVSQMFSYAADTPANRAAAVARNRPTAFAVPAAAQPAAAARPQAQQQQTPMQQQQNYISGMASWVKQTGGRVTSIGRSQERNAAVGGVGNSFHLTARGMDSTPPKGISMAAWRDQVAAKAGPGWEAINEGDHVHLEPAGGAGGNVSAGAGNIGPGFINPFDASYYNQAAGQLDAAAAAAKQGRTFTYTPEAAPELPDAQSFLPPKTDFSQVDEALRALKPEEQSEAAQLQMRRQQWFAGIGQALMQLPESAGLGKVLAAVGGGAMIGGAEGDALVRRESEKFDAKMAQYNMAVLRNESDKAATHQREAAQAADMLYKHSMAKWETSYKQWSQYNTVNMDGQGNVVASMRDAKTGQVVQRFVPNGAAIDAATAQKKAELFMHAGDQANAASRMVATQQNALIANAAVTSLQQSGDSDPSALLSTPAFIASTIVDGGGLDALLASAWDGDGAKAAAGKAKLQADADAAAMTQLGGQVDPGLEGLMRQEAIAKIRNSSEYREAYRKSIINQLSILALDPSRPGFRKKLFDMGGVYAAGAAGMARAQQRTSTRTTPKGTTTTTTTDLGDQ